MTFPGSFCLIIAFALQASRACRLPLWQSLETPLTPAAALAFFPRSAARKDVYEGAKYTMFLTLPRFGSGINIVGLSNPVFASANKNFTGPHQDFSTAVVVTPGHYWSTLLFGICSSPKTWFLTSLTLGRRNKSLALQAGS